MTGDADETTEEAASALPRWATTTGPPRSRGRRTGAHERSSPSAVDSRRSPLSRKWLSSSVLETRPERQRVVILGSRATPPHRCR